MTRDIDESLRAIAEGIEAITDEMRAQLENKRQARLMRKERRREICVSVLIALVSFAVIVGLLLTGVARP